MPNNHIALPAVAAPDDTAVQVLPQSQVDYLSHVWKEEDVWRSWRNMTRQKNAIANGTRLENASWRTWWKQRNKLKTISPETLNWLKDSDVTWLYGPLHSAGPVHAVPPAKVSTTADRLNLLGGSNQRLKPILKHRSIFEMLTNQMPVSPFNDGYIEFDDGPSDSYFPPQSQSQSQSSSSAVPVPVPAPPQAPSPSRTRIPHTKSDTNLLDNGLRPRRTSPKPAARSLERHARFAQRASPSLRTPSSEAEPRAERHISFNTVVEQCIAIEKPLDSPSDDDEDSSSDELDDESEDDVLEFRTRTTATPAMPKKPSLVRHHSHSGDRGHVTIAPIAPTILKTSESFPNLSPSIVYVPPHGSHYGSSTPPASFELDEDVPFSSSRVRPSYSYSSIPAPRYGAGSEMDDYLTHADLDADATPDLGFGDQFSSGATSPRGRREGPAAARYNAVASAGAGQFYSGADGRRHHRVSPSASPVDSPSASPSPSAPIDIAAPRAGDMLSAHVAPPRGRSLSSSGSGSVSVSPSGEERGRGRSAVRGSASSGLSDRSRSGSKHRVESTSPIGSISPNPSRSGSILGAVGANARGGGGGANLVATASDLARGRIPSNSPSPPEPANVSSSPKHQTLKQALGAKAKEQVFVRPSLVINRDALDADTDRGTSGEHSSPPSLSPTEAEARKRDDYWADGPGKGPVPAAPHGDRAHASKAPQRDPRTALADPPAPSPSSSTTTTATTATTTTADDNRLVGRAVDIVSSARGMIRGIFNSSGRE